MTRIQPRPESLVGTGTITQIQPEPTKTAVPLEQVASYEILGELGRGGMGVVYKARHKQLKRIVALKMIISGTRASEADLSRFRAEAEAVAQLQHPNIVQVFEVGEEEGRPFFALEFVDGGSLDKKIGGSPWLPLPAANLIEQVARAVGHAHAYGIVHRDLKPANILLQRTYLEGDATEIIEGVCRLDAATFTPKITDFGLAKRLDHDSGLSLSGQIMGTPSYMAPEQARGEVHRIGPSADIWALGAILYELLTGRPPFKGASMMDTILMVQDQEPVSPRQLNPRVPVDLETIALKCLHKDPTRRYPSAHGLAEDLRRYREGEPISARPVGWIERSVKWAVRHRVWAVVLAVSALAFITMFLFFATKYQLTQIELRRREQAESLRDQIGKALSDGQGQAGQSRLLEARTTLQSALNLYDSQADLINDPGLRERVDQRLGILNQEIEVEAKKAALVQQRSEATAALAALRSHRDDVVFHSLLATGELPEVSLAKTRAAVDAAVLIPMTKFAPLDEKSHFEAAQALNESLLLGVWAELRAKKNGDRQRALRFLDEARSLAETYRLPPGTEQALRRDYEGQDLFAGLAKDDPTALFLHAIREYTSGHYREAAASCQQLNLLEPTHYWGRYLEALSHIQLGQWADGRANLTVCLDRRPQFIWPYLLRGFAAMQMNDYVSAREDFDLALQASPDGTVGYVGWVNRAVLSIRQDRHEAAIADLQKAIALDPDNFQAYVNLSQAELGRHNLPAAAKALDKAIACRKDLASLYRRRARLRLQLGEKSLAETDLRTTLRLETIKSRSSLLADDHVELGHLLAERGRPAEALEQYNLALKLRPDDTIALRLKAAALLDLQKPIEAGEALDRYLALSRAPDVADYNARALLYVDQRQDLKAVDMFTLALQAKPDDTTALAGRAWSYMNLDSPRPALADFNALLQIQNRDVDALSGRGLARVRLGDIANGLSDAEAAVKLLEQNVPLPRSVRPAQILIRAASSYARACNDDLDFASERRHRAIDLIAAALASRPEDDRRRYWRDHIATLPALMSLADQPAFARLARRFGSGSGGPSP